MTDLFGSIQPLQSGLDFPIALTERYRPQAIDQFIGLDKPKKLARAAERGRDEDESAVQFVAIADRVMQGARGIASACSKTMAKRIANALNRHKPSREGV